MVKVFLTLLFLFSFAAAKEINITSTVKPLADIAKEVVKDKANVSYIIPPNVSIHLYEYKISDIKKVKNSDLFIYISVGEPNVNNLVKIAPPKSLLNVSQIDGIYLIKSFEFHKEDKHEHHRESFHPALWLDPYNAKIIAKAVYERISLLDKENKDFYRKNYESFAKKCDEVVIYGKNKMSSLKVKDFISYHYAWPYFTNRFGLNYLAVIELGHGREPTIKHIIKIINLIKDRKIKSIFASIQFYNPKYTNLIKRQTGVDIVLLDPFGIKKDYLSMIKTNIDKIYKGLK